VTIWVALTTPVPETGTVNDEGLPGVDTLTVLTGQPVAAAITGVMKPVPVMMGTYLCPVNHTLGETEVIVGMEQTDTGGWRTLFFHQLTLR
jgi:hypothetical protein